MNWILCKSGKWSLRDGRKTVGEIYVETYPKEGTEYVPYIGRFGKGGVRLGFKRSLEQAKYSILEELGEL